MKITSTNDYSIYHHLPEGSYDNLIVITFDNIQGGLNPKGFGSDFLSKNKIENIFVSHKKGSFFQGLSDTNLANILEPFIKGKKVYTYGSSLGGYAALYYAKLLSADVIAFSPRCSINPIYTDYFIHNVEFVHSKLKYNEGSKNLIILDPLVEKDATYLNEIIEPTLKDTIEVIEMPYANHGTAEAMLSEGILKDFVLNFIINRKVLDYKYNPENNCFSLSELALSAALKKNYEYANYCLERLILLGGRPRGNIRLRAYYILINSNKLNHFLDYRLIYASEKRSIYSKKIRGLKTAETVTESLFGIFRMHMELLEFDLAMKFAVQIKKVYRQYEEENGLISTASRFIANSEKWIQFDA